MTLQKIHDLGQKLDQRPPWPMGFQQDDCIENRYRLTAFLGEGGMGCVFKATDLHLNRTVALKFMKRVSQEPQRHLLREARLQALVVHDHICQVFEVGNHRGLYFLAMQFLSGKPLQDFVDALHLEAKLKLMRDVAMAIHEAHGHGLIHRDLKPNNILVSVDSQGRLKPYVMDFGLARRLSETQSTRTGLLQGTPLFMAPEQVRGARSDMDRRTDVYGLGGTLHFLLSGLAPHRADNPAALLVAILDKEVPSLRKQLPTLPKDVDAIVASALAQNPQRRYGSAKAFGEDIDRFLRGEPVLANPPSFWERLAYLAKRHKKWLALGTLSLTAVFMVFAWGMVSRNKLEKKARIASAFVQRSQEVEAFHRKISMLPSHEISEARSHLKKLMTEVEQQMTALGDLATGPGYFALGSAHLALQDYALAQQHLQYAWDAEFREPAVALALGQTLNALYQRELARIEGLSEAEARILARQAALRKFRDPARGILDMDATWPQEARLEASALLALFDGREEAAVDLWQRLFDQQPWYYEALLYQGQVLTRMGDQHRDAGDTPRAEALYGNAQDKLSLAADVGRSDAEVFIALASLQLAKAIAHQESLMANPGETQQAVKSRCHQALLIDPSRAEPHRILAALSILQADEAFKQGQNPEPYLNKVLDHSRACLERNPNVAAAHNSIGSSHLFMGRYLFSQGKDGLPHFGQAVAALEQGLALHPNQSALHNNLGLAHLYLFQLSNDPPTPHAPHYRKAVSHLKRARNILPGRISTWLNLGVVHWMLAEALLFAGEDPIDALCLAQESFEEVLLRQPNNIRAQINLGNTFQLQGEYALEHFQEAGPLLSQAIENFQSVIAFKPELPELANALSVSYSHLAKKAWQEGASPFAFLNTAIDWSMRALEVRPHWDLALYNLGEFYRLKLTYARALDHPVTSYGALATEVVQEFLRINNQHADAWVTLGDITAALAGNNPASAKYDEAKTYYDKALALDSGNGFAHVSLARIALNRASGLNSSKKVPFSQKAAIKKHLDLAARGGVSQAEVNFLHGFALLQEIRSAHAHPGYYQRLLATGADFLKRQMEAHPRDLRNRWLFYELQLHGNLNQKNAVIKQLPSNAIQRELQKIMVQNPNLTAYFQKHSGLLMSSQADQRNQQSSQGVLN